MTSLEDDRTQQYALEVLNGEIIACEKVRQACERHMTDLELSKDSAYPYYFDVEEANEIFNFFELLKYTDGEIAGQQVKLAGFQCFILGNLFGWKKKSDNYRRFRKSYVQVARKNSKTLLNSGIAIKMNSFDGYRKAQVYCTATKMAQARIAWNHSKEFINIDPFLKRDYKVKEHDAILEDKITGGTIRALGRDTGTIDGFNPHAGIVDEYHAHKTNQMLKQLEDGTVTQKQSLISIITTAGEDLKCPCYSEYEYAAKILEGVVENDTEFVYIAELDNESEYKDPNMWIKANPLLPQIDGGLENLKNLYRPAAEKGGDDLRDFLTKSCNMWVAYQKNKYLNIKKFKACQSELTLDDFNGSPVYIGLDLSSGGDLTSYAIEIPYTDAASGEPFVHIYTKSFMPSQRIIEHEQTDKAPYRMWVKKGLIILTETLKGYKTDYKYIIADLKALIKKHKFKVQLIGYDPHNADAFLQDLEEIGDCVEIVQSCKSLNDATVDFKLLVEAGHVTYNKEDAVLLYSAANARVVSNSFKEIKIDKDLSTERIDPVDAVIDAHKCCFKQPKPKKEIFYAPDLD